MTETTDNRFYAAGVTYSTMSEEARAVLGLLIGAAILAVVVILRFSGLR